MTPVWVVGSGGLLGSAIVRSPLLGKDIRAWQPARQFAWRQWNTMAQQMRQAVTAFGAYAEGAARWEIYWAAGIGTMSTSSEVLVQETRALEYMLELMSADPHLMASSGAFALSSSAGAVYAGASDEVITEDTPPAPTTAYAREKLAQEQLMLDFTQRHPQIRSAAARISTVYGVGKDMSKPQGLLTHIARSILHRRPVQIYVPYDTIRDYIAADDAAMAMIAALRCTSGQRPHLTRIVASERPTTIAEIIATFKRVSRRAPRIVTSASQLSALYSKRIQFRSLLPEARPPEAPRSLLIGISQLMDAELDAFASSPRPRH